MSAWKGWMFGPGPARASDVAALVPLENADAESVSLSTNPKFLAIIERSRSSLREKGGISAKDVRRELGLDDDDEVEMVEGKAGPGPRTP